MGKKKVETQEQRMLRRKKEERELARWEKELAKPARNQAFWFTLFLITVSYLIDELTTVINTQMQTEIAIGLFEDRMSIMSLASMLSLPVMLLAVFYKSLSDRYGRKFFVFFNTLGMGIGLFIVFLAGKMAGIGGAVLYVVASAVINFFVPNDTQVIYIMESADERKRGTYYSISKFFATIGIMLIPLMRKAFMGDNQALWYNVYLVPAVVAGIAAVICFVFLREPEVFVRKRIGYLKMTDQEREAEAENGAAGESGSIGKAFQFAFAHKQLRWLFIIVGIWGIGSFGTSYYARIMANYYSTEEVTSALLMYPLTCAVMYLFNGILGDKLGRKFVQVTLAGTSLVSFSLLFLGCSLHISPVAAGLLVGAYTGSFYAAGDNIITLMTGESAPTNMRASVMSAIGVVNIVSKMFAMIIPTVGLLISGDNYDVLGWICIFGSIPALALAVFFLITKVGDTNRVSLDTVRGDEWDE